MKKQKKIIEETYSHTINGKSNAKKYNSIISFKNSCIGYIKTFKIPFYFIYLFYLIT